jgi:IS30 family transposase
LLKQNIGLDAIWSACGGDLGISKRTFYRWVELGYGFCNLDLPKKVCYKKRKSEKEVRPRIDFSNRTYSDFSNLDEQVRLSAFEADCICGVKTDSKAILTLLHKRTHFQIGILLEKQDSAHVISAIDFIESVSSGRFRDLFATILADRGSEFLDILGIEREGKRKRCSLYFCDPRSPHQKGQCEKNHVEVRKILPKGTSFDELDSADIAEVFSHVNSTPRTSLGGISPIELAFSIFPKSLFEETGLRHIPLNELCLKPLRQIRK